MGVKKEMTAQDTAVGTDAGQSSEELCDTIIHDSGYDFNSDFPYCDSWSDLYMIQMSAIEPEDVEWLWFPYIPLGKLTIIQGDPGEGKTSLALAVASAISTGRPLYDGCPRGSPANVIFQTAEDGLADTIRPRLDKTGADSSRIFVIDESQKCLSLSDKRIEEAIKRVRARLLILDPIQAYLGSDVDMNRANETRQLLKMLAQTAEHTNCSVVMIAHLGKRTQNAIRRSIGSMDFPAAARSVLFVGHSSDERIIAQAKNSLAEKGPSLTFTLDDGFRITGTSDKTADDLNQSSDAGTTMTKTETAVQKLRELLADGPMESRKIFEQFKAMRIGQRTVEEAKKIINARAYKEKNSWYWQL